EGLLRAGDAARVEVLGAQTSGRRDRDLPSQIAALESAMAGQTDSRRAHKVARRVADAELKSGSQAMDALERIYMNASGGNTGAVNDWKEARRVGPSRTVVPPAAVAT